MVLDDLGWHIITHNSVFLPPFHGGNRGSNPLRDATTNGNEYIYYKLLVSIDCFLLKKLIKLNIETKIFHKQLFSGLMV